MKNEVKPIRIAEWVFLALEAVFAVAGIVLMMMGSDWDVLMFMLVVVNLIIAGILWVLDMAC